MPDEEEWDRIDEIRAAVRSGASVGIESQRFLLAVIDRLRSVLREVER